jgi:tetratricopeptide (TPR) repeat protein
MRNKPFVEKLGRVPHPEMMRLASADQKEFVANSLVLKTLIYYGTLVEKSKAKIDVPPDYYTIFKTIQAAVTLDPYNMDAYYFTQAVLVWDVKRIREVNTLLEHGMKYRDWDFYLPFFAGFNYSYFLHDYAKAAACYRRAGELSGDELHANLAGRYFYESGQTDLAIAFLTTMVKSAKTAAIQKSLAVRLKALEVVREIELAKSRLESDCPGCTLSIEELVRRGYLAEVPVDPYGGKFFIDSAGKVRSTSGFARKTRPDSPASQER